MKPFIFTGPSLSVNEAQTQLDAVYLPPVKYGDVYQITQLYQPQVIGIIDGYFNQVPSVWHKEILWAMNQGASVFGASSMGALRAAELAPLGMIGCGKIFNAYQKGILLPYVDDVFEDDDEVAVTHTPAELGYKALSDAMVNIRITLAKAQQLGKIDLQSRDSLIEIAKSLFYPKRSYQHILDLAAQRGMEKAIVDQLSHWIRENRIDQKKADALTLLTRIKEHQPTKSANHSHTVTDFVHTSQWQSAINEIDESHRIELIVLNEIRLQGPRYFEILERSLSSIFVQDQHNNSIDAEVLTSLHPSTDDMDKLLSQHWQIMNNQSTLAQLSLSACEQRILGYLEQTGELSTLEARAIKKQVVLSDMKLPSVVELSDIDLLQLADWYFTGQLGMEQPAQLEIYAANLGFIDIDAFYAMILKEYYYKQEL